MRLPEFITFTGVDDHTDINDLIDLQKNYRVEFGVLFSPKLQGSGRYPTLECVDRVRRAGLILAAHICGGHSRALIKDGVVDVDLTGFFRLQVNTADQDLDLAAIQEFAMSQGLSRAIVQCRGEFPTDSDVAWLYDTSGGRGERPTAWPKHPDDLRMVGYAGGNTPDNVRDILGQIDCSGPYWIDMESGVRVDDKFSVEKCREVCQKVFGY